MVFQEIFISSLLHKHYPHKPISVASVTLLFKLMSWSSSWKVILSDLDRLFLGWVIFIYILDSSFLIGSSSGTDIAVLFTMHILKIIIKCHQKTWHPVWKMEISGHHSISTIIIIFTNPFARAGYDTRSIFKRSLIGLNSEFSFS